MASLPINPFDGAVYFCLFVAVVIGFISGLLRSLATIFGYLAAMGFAVALVPPLSAMLTDRFKLPPAQIWIVFAVIFLVAGVALSALLRRVVNEMACPSVSIPDRVAGALLGAVRVGLLAVLIVVIFDRIIPPGREPAFLKGSQWRPALSDVGRRGLKSLPPEVENYIDRLKHQHGL